MNTSHTKSVFVVGGDFLIENMFLDKGWNIVYDIEDCDIVQFCGGEDVTPTMYSEYTHPTTSCNEDRDRKEVEIFNLAKALAIPMAGICRGGQFLNVMCGGSLIQNVDNHAIGGLHDAWIIGGLVKVEVTSTHHQMMEPNFHSKDCEILMTANLSTKWERMSSISGGKNEHIIYLGKSSSPKTNKDIEALFYHNNKCLCFQPHPEYNEAEKCRELYFNWIDHYLLNHNKD